MFHNCFGVCDSVFFPPNLTDWLTLMVPHGIPSCYQGCANERNKPTTDRRKIYIQKTAMVINFDKPIRKKSIIFLIYVMTCWLFQFFFCLLHQSYTFERILFNMRHYLFDKNLESSFHNKEDKKKWIILFRTCVSSRISSIINIIYLFVTKRKMRR
jgi:hypothetical protein